MDFLKRKQATPGNVEDDFEHYIFRKEHKKQVKYNRYTYYLKHSNKKKKYICYYKKANGENIIRLTPHIYMEDICKIQKLKKFHDTICSQVNTLVHDVRTAVTLTSINMQLLSELLEETRNVNGINDPAKRAELHGKAHEYINAALEGCYIQNEYTIALTQLVEKEQDNVYINNMKFDIVQTLQKTINFFAHYARRNCVLLQWKGDVTPCMMNSDEVKIRETVTNILQNAIKYTACKKEGEKKVIVSIKQTKKHIKIKIKDTGIGIYKEDLQHIKEKYFRARKAGESVPYGRGLGLFAAYNNIELIDGEITCKSEIGKGSTFTIEVPRGSI